MVHPDSRDALCYLLLLHTEARTVLIQAGVDVNAVNKKGETALMRAVSASNHRYAKLLLAHNADPTIQSLDGKTVIDMNVRPDIRKLLVEAIEKWEAEHGEGKP